MTEATRITIDNIERMIEKIAETEYRRGYADALKEKELTEKHWKQAEVTDLLHGLWKERIKEREDKGEGMHNEEVINKLKRVKSIIGLSISESEEKSLDMLIKALRQKPTKIDLDELKLRILMEVDGGTDDRMLRYCDVCDRISNSIDNYKAEVREKE